MTEKEKNEERKGNSGGAQPFAEPSPDPAPPKTPSAIEPSRGPTNPFAGGETEDELRRSKDVRDAEESEPTEALPEGDDDGNFAADKPAPGGGFAPPPAEAPKSKKATSTPSSPAKPKPSQSWGDVDAFKADDIGSGGGWGGGFGRTRHWRPVPRLKVAASAPPSGKNLALIESLRRAVALDPSKRSAHGALVRAAIRVGHHDALAFARAWADVDPEHAPALSSLADVLASQGDPIAQRAYASALEITPFSKSTHDALARAFANKGDLARSCSHRRAVVSIDPSDAGHHAELAKCLHQSGRSSAARVVLTDARGRATKNLAALAKADAALAGVVPVSAPLKGQLRATLSWSGEDDLDIAIVDAGGHRLSASHPKQLAVRESAGFEELAMSKVKKSVFVEVTRNGSVESGRLAPIRATLEVRTSSGTKTFPVVLENGSVRLAKVFWTG